MLIENQRRHAGNMRRGHRRTAQSLVDVVRTRTENINPGRCEINTVGPVVRKDGAIVIVVGRGDRDHVVQIEAGRIEGILVIVLSQTNEVAVAGARHEYLSRQAGIFHRIIQMPEKTVHCRPNCYSRSEPPFAWRS